MLSAWLHVDFVRKPAKAHAGAIRRDRYGSRRRGGRRGRGRRRRQTRTWRRKGIEARSALAGLVMKRTDDESCALAGSGFARGRFRRGGRPPNVYAEEGPLAALVSVD